MDENEDNSNSQRVLKIIVVGDMGTGKTALIRKFVEGNFSEFYKITIGVDFANKIVKCDNASADVQLWDIAGQERFGNMTGVYYREAVGAVVVFDVMRNPTFDMTKVWKKDIYEKVRTSKGQPVPIILLGNKIDLMEKDENWEKRKEEIMEYSKENNFLGFFETSAKEGINVEESLMYLVEYILKNNIESESSRNEGVKLGEEQQQQKEGGCGC